MTKSVDMSPTAEGFNESFQGVFTGATPQSCFHSGLRVQIQSLWRLDLKSELSIWQAPLLHLSICNNLEKTPPLDISQQLQVSGIYDRRARVRRH